MSIEIPAGLTDLLKGYTVEVLRSRPPDLVEFAIQYFSRLRESNTFRPISRSPDPTLTERKAVSFEEDAQPSGLSADEEDDAFSEELHFKRAYNAYVWNNV